MRIDKYLKNSRIIKRRTVAKEACEQGRVLINGKLAKPGDEVKIGDRVQINFTNPIEIEVLDVSDNPRKDASKELYKMLN
ncbi:MAG: RNA-binding S4 domain-containing protein [Tissierellaceae bacterium]|nr:RNA-binding S4 domain-containing protein [Tissierellaceae bacterium]